MRDLSTNEKFDTLETTTGIPHFCSNSPEAFRTSRYGLNYWTSPQPRIRCNPHHRRSWMLVCSHLSSLSYDNYRPSNYSKIFVTPLSLVWITRQDYFGPRPVIYIALWEGIDTRIENSAKHIDSLSSPNRRSYGTNESMGEAIPDRKSTRLNSSHRSLSRMPSSA